MQNAKTQFETVCKLLKKFEITYDIEEIEAITNYSLKNPCLDNDYKCDR